MVLEIKRHVIGMKVCLPGNVEVHIRDKEVAWHKESEL